MNNTFLTKIRYAKKYLLGNEFHNEHFEAAIDVLDIMASKKPHTNHIILDAPTQSGKTSVMEMIYRVLNFEKTYEKYGIEQVIYMTADNGSGEGSLKNQTTNRFRGHWKNYVHSLPIDFLKRSDFDKFNHIMENTLIMVDESQYGWREITSKGQKVLQVGGVNFCSIEELQNRNTYILSVSATTQNERYGDSILKLKPIVNLKPGKGYVGFEDFFNNNFLKPVSKSDFIDTYEKLDDFLSNQSKKLKIIYKRTNIAKCVILRLFDNKRKNFFTDSEEFESICEQNGFTYKLITCKDSRIDYSSLQANIYYNCNHYNENNKKFHLIVIKNALSYGITINSEIKKLIATCYDVRKDTNSTEATEQGTMGRMCGYGCSIDDLKDLEIYINETHYEGIKSCRIYLSNPYSTPLKRGVKKVRVKCKKNEWDRNIKNIVVWNSGETLMFEGDFVDKFFKKHNEYNTDKLFSNDSFSNCGSFLTEIMNDFLEETHVLEKHGINKNNLIELRRKFRTNDYNADRIFKTEPLIESASREKNWRTEEKADKNELAYGFLIDVTNANKKSKKGVVIKISYGNVGYAKIDECNEIVTKKRKMYDGYNTALGLTVADTSYC